MKIIFLFLTVFATSVALADVASDSSKTSKRLMYDTSGGYSEDVKQVLLKFSKIPNIGQMARELSIEHLVNWRMGPSFYRGLLGTNKIEVLVLDGSPSTDSVIARRSMSGPLGKYLQPHVKSLGSYLYLQAFPYMLNLDSPLSYSSSKYEDLKLLRLIADPSSPVTKWRNDLLHHIIKNNADTLKVIVTVDEIADLALEKYFHSLNMKCLATNTYSLDLLKGCSKDKAFQKYTKYNVKLIQLSVDKFKLKQVLKTSRPPHTDSLNSLVSLKPFQSLERYVAPKNLVSSDIPMHDFAFGSAQALLTTQSEAQKGKIDLEDLSVNRGQKRSGETSEFAFDFGLFKETPVEVSSQDLRESLNAKSTAFTDASEHTSNLPWEHNKQDTFNFDAGPGPYWSEVFAGTRSDVSNLSNAIFHNNGSIEASNSPHGAFSIYRGRPNSTRVLILADQFSNDDLLTGRALSGEEGQRLQAFLYSIKAGTHYTILRTLPIDTLHASDEDKEQLIHLTQKWRNNVWDKLLNNTHNKQNIQLIIALGKHASSQFTRKLLNTNDIPIIFIEHEFSTFTFNFQTGLDMLPSPYKVAFNRVLKTESWNQSNMQFVDTLLSIPRIDLPWGLPRWYGSSGDRVISTKDANEGFVYRVVAPNWLDSWNSKLSEEEAQFINSVR